MRGRRGRAAATAAALVGVLALAGCGGADESSSPSSGAGDEGVPSPSGETDPSPYPTQATPSPTDGDRAGEPGEGAQDLAEQAEGLAEETRIAPRSGNVLGSDISWPQCPVGMGIPEKRTLGMPGPLPEAEYVIVGLTNGPGFTPNPCLADQVAQTRRSGKLISAYSVASYPDAAQLEEHADDGPYDGSTPAGALRNTGYQQALYNVASMEATGFETPFVWIDVEPVPDFEWSADPAANAEVVRGIARGYTDSGYGIGVYSTPALWAGVVGDLELGIPEWRAAGQTSAAEALSRCGDDWVIQGGEAVMGQWVEASRDQNLTCDGAARDLDLYFHQY
ncbi:hypothetical protein [Nocardioides sp. CFH 31398]|uniref:hypothetical protein n=1 Tax=Nocardioides sp. CFH 31398 TaxID=2919579 RepID=UPI001F06599A|nr:hypothetical protein [Nocardioides sp. CFH 31398]MCH1867552.1 hypothetical protein [Nocardioides sp. CFH 31398]